MSRTHDRVVSIPTHEITSKQELIQLERWLVHLRKDFVRLYVEKFLTENVNYKQVSQTVARSKHEAQRMAKARWQIVQELLLHEATRLVNTSKLTEDGHSSWLAQELLPLLRSEEQLRAAAENTSSAQKFNAYIRAEFVGEEFFSSLASATVETKEEIRRKRHQFISTLIDQDFSIISRENTTSGLDFIAELRQKPGLQFLLQLLAPDQRESYYSNSEILAAVGWVMVATLLIFAATNFSDLMKYTPTLYPHLPEWDSSITEYIDEDAATQYLQEQKQFSENGLFIIRHNSEVEGTLFKNIRISIVLDGQVTQRMADFTVGNQPDVTFYHYNFKEEWYGSPRLNDKVILAILDTQGADTKVPTFYTPYQPDLQLVFYPLDVRDLSKLEENGLTDKRIRPLLEEAISANKKIYWRNMGSDLRQITSAFPMVGTITVE